MTSEEIIERLLDERKITVKEALVILKDLAKIGLSQLTNKNITSDDIERVLNNPHVITPPTVVTMYACTPISWWENNNNDNSVTYTNTSFDSSCKSE